MQTWGILLYRNRPRDFRYQIFNVKLPRGKSCFICNEEKITLSGLPGSNHYVLAPYATGRRESFPRNDVAGSPLEDRPVHLEAGIDAKWTPNADTAIDATINPDFSQVESDVA
ncbi:MAG TPA: hydrolase, partial [Thermoanaerobaculia bacterium]